VTAGLNEERPRAAGKVADLEVEEFPRRAELPVFARSPLRGAYVHERFECVLDDRLGEAPGRVLRARGSAGPPFCDEEGPGGNHKGVAEAVRPHQVCEWPDAGP